MKRLESNVSTFPRSTLARWWGLMIGLLALSLWALPAHAEDDPPARVGRLSEVEGQVWLYDTQGAEWIEAERNRPITTGDRLSTERGSRAEVRIGSTVLRLDANTELEVTRLDDEHVELQLHSGAVATRLRSREAAREFLLTTAEGRFEATRAGNYRFDRHDDTSEATVASGQLQFSAPGSELAVNAGQRVEFWDDNGIRHSFGEPGRDDFADWVASRDGREERSVSSRYVSPEMTGVEDLDRHGRWRQDSEYGPLWTPVAVAPGWAPYRMGHWAWISPWGWTWVDDAPWGFAPFHYGRWVYVRNSWCWSPGRYVARPVYAPALVAWVGGPRVGVSVTIGRPQPVGWFPLAPREVYVPSYRFSSGYLRHVNHGHVHEIRNINTIVNNPGRSVEHFSYRHRGVPQAVTIVPSTVLERRQPVAPAIGGMNSRLRQEAFRQPPRIDAPVAPIGRRLDRPAVGVPVVVPPPPGGRESNRADGGGWRPGVGRSGEREPRGERDSRPGRDPQGSGQQFSRDRRGDAPVPPLPTVQVSPPAAPPAFGRPVPSAPAPAPREDTRFGRPPTPAPDGDRDRHAFGERSRPPQPSPQQPAPQMQVMPPAAQPAPVRPPLPFSGRDGGHAQPGAPSRESGGHAFGRQPVQESPRVERNEPPRPPAGFAPPPRAVVPPPPPPPPPPRAVAPPPPPPPQVRAPAPPPAPHPLTRERDERRGGGPGNEPGRGDGFRNR